MALHRRMLVAVTRVPEFPVLAAPEVVLAEDVLAPLAGTLDPEETGDVALALG